MSDSQENDSHLTLSPVKGEAVQWVRNMPQCLTVTQHRDLLSLLESIKTAGLSQFAELGSGASLCQNWQKKCDFSSDEACQQALRIILRDVDEYSAGVFMQCKEKVQKLLHIVGGKPLAKLADYAFQLPSPIVAVGSDRDSSLDSVIAGLVEYQIVSGVIAPSAGDFFIPLIASLFTSKESKRRKCIENICLEARERATTRLSRAFDELHALLELTVKL